MKQYGVITAVTPLEMRTKKDGSGQYEYADVTVQLFDKDCKPGVHQRYDWQTGEALPAVADVAKMDAVREKAQKLVAEGWKVGDIVVVDTTYYVDKFCHNIVNIEKIERYQQAQNAPRP